MTISPFGFDSKERKVDIQILAHRMATAITVRLVFLAIQRGQIYGPHYQMMGILSDIKMVNYRYFSCVYECTHIHVYTHI